MTTPQPEPDTPQSVSLNELSLEQQFAIRSFETQVSQMNLEQAQLLLVQLYEQMITRDTIYKNLLKHKWGME